MSEQRKNNFIVQGSILAIAGIISRIIGMLFRIPMLSIIVAIEMVGRNIGYNGDVGMEVVGVVKLE